jgi:hypothetical protein
MFFSGFALFLYKPMYVYLLETNPNPQLETQQETHQETKKMETNYVNDFIKEIYSVKPETGGVDYLCCNCKNFPEYNPAESQIHLQIDSEEIIHSSK